MSIDMVLTVAALVCFVVGALDIQPGRMVAGGLALLTLTLLV